MQTSGQPRHCCLAGQSKEKWSLEEVATCTKGRQDVGMLASNNKCMAEWAGFSAGSILHGKFRFSD